MTVDARYNNGVVQQRKPARPFPSALLLYALFTAIYMFSPLDAVPDVIPIFGVMDDIGVLGLLGMMFLAHQMGVDINGERIAMVIGLTIFMFVLLWVLGSLALLKYILSPSNP
eukprot:NODE_9450_length_641_cov_105.019305_g9184_i0.p1 GENE.NODE_9450_length_641_cov_105.019305_g9184_i0~~NODE_9450_length_641_cov_105.019305_g9184_i0.p1  ORF type:complete len:113 (+),score=23.48 NODE_9450_length_641_cov_105.019305_g9184_i0:101-439(+)